MIALAITLSLIIHAVILWLPHITLPQSRLEFPPWSGATAKAGQIDYRKAGTCEACTAQ